MHWFDREGLRAQAGFYNVESIALELYKAAIQKLDEQQKEYHQKADAYRAKLTTEDEYSMFSEEQDWEEQLYSRRKQALGILPLHLLQLSVKERLERAKAYFDSTRPGHGGYGNKKGWPNRLKSEYKERFGIDFERSPVPFERIEELVLARNAAVHSDNPDNMKEYLGKVTNPRFVNEEDEFWVDVTGYQAAVSDAEAFMQWVISELEKLVP